MFACILKSSKNFDVSSFSIIHIFYSVLSAYIMRGVSMKKSCIYLENCKREMKTNKHLPAKNDLNHKIECIWAFLGYKML